MAMKVQKLDVEAAAKAATDFTHRMNEALNHFNSRHYAPKIWEVVMEQELLQIERVFRLLVDNKIPNSARNTEGKIVMWFEDKSEAKIVRDVVNEESRAGLLWDGKRHPSNFKGLVQVHQGPDHRCRAASGTSGKTAMRKGR